MACIFFVSLVLFLSLSPGVVKPSPDAPSSISPAIRQACKATRFPSQCETSLTQSNHVPPNPTPLQLIQSAIWVSTQNLHTAQSMVNSIKDSSAGNANLTAAVKSCTEALSNSEYRVSRTTEDALPHGRIKDARIWLSASLQYQQGCWSALKLVNDTQMVNSTMSFLDSLVGLTSNALSMVFSYDIFGNETGSWAPPKTERDQFWEGSGSSGSDFRGGFPSKLMADATVCKDGSGGCYKTVQEAVNATPDNAGQRKFVIHIKEGVYEEIVRIPLEKKNVVFLGDGMGKTVITGSLNVGMPGLSTYHTATVGVLGDGFMANGLTIQNTAGPNAHQAVAFRSDSDLSVIENCEFLGNQDTLYPRALRQFYKSCRIQGNVDFIFGNSASIFQDCQILVSPRQVDPAKGEQNTITAHSRNDPAQSTGFVFHNCSINGTEEYMVLYHNNPKVHRNYLGRPWKEYSRTVFINCNLEALITPEGWTPWDEDFALKTLYYGEFGNSGPGSNLSQRVTWSSQIPKDHILSYSVEKFIQGDEWIPSSS
ncbi:probable pectinesterase/pectinesterase inhibitor 51 [Juglans regia]|uniref:pectinesterase n=1 Tax=Juglans regia TaxID=51240 RepID=A0A2I4E6P0_JUGRE|nr:probable pectinesterase/pectinesterase inhibitor 51 [Juglans regia]